MAGSLEAAGHRTDAVAEPRPPPLPPKAPPPRQSEPDERHAGVECLQPVFP